MTIEDFFPSIYQVEVKMEEGIDDISFDSTASYYAEAGISVESFTHIIVDGSNIYLGVEGI